MSRATKGLSFTHFLHVDGDEDDESILKDPNVWRVFVIVHQQSENLEWTIQRVVSSFKTTTFIEIGNDEQYDQKFLDISKKIDETRNIIKMTI